MAAEVVPYFLPQFFDNNGKPLAGGKVYTYKAGTTTPITTYKDASFTPNENPIILDSAGRASIYVGIQPVKFVICDADDNVIETRDHVSGASSTAVGIQTVVPIETDGVETEFDLGVDPELASNCTVVLVTSGGDRITFLTSEYTVSGTKIIFNSPPPAGTGEVRIGATRAIASSGLSDGSVSTQKLQDGVVTNAKLADNSVGTSKIQDGAVTLAKMAEDSVDTDQLVAGAVDTTAIADGAVTNAKRAPLGIQISGSSGAFSTTSAVNYVDVPNLSVSITTSGRPVFIGLIHDGGGTTGWIGPTSVDEDPTTMYFRFDRSGTSLGPNVISTRVSSGEVAQNQFHPLSSVWTIDTPPAGTYTYKLQVLAGWTTVNANVRQAKLIAYEL